MKKICLLLLILFFLGSSFRIVAQPVIKISAIDKRCVNGAIISLNNFVTVDGVFKPGGIWSSPSAGLIYGDKFNPVAAGVSTAPGWKVKYEYTDPISGLYAKDSAYVTIYALPKPFAGLDDTICTGAKKPLTGTPSIPPGTWRGPGVEGSYPNWKFNPDTPGIINSGTYSVIYHYADYNNCENEDTMKITVYKTPVADAGISRDFCIDGSSISLTGLPAGGIWTGKGVAGNQFYPALANSGMHILTYQYTNVICTATDTAKYTVWDLPVVTANTMSGQTFFCRNYGIVQLNGQPGGSGGVWSGPGVSGATFNTAIGADATTDYSLRYEYTDSHKCKNKDDMIIKVKPEPTVVIDPAVLCFGIPFTISAQYSHADGIFWWKGAQSDGNITGDPTSSTISYDPGLNDLSRLYFWMYIKTTHSDSVCAPAYDSIKVNMSAMPVPEFEADQNTGSAPLTVQFTDLSTVNPGKITNWEWSFGDGEKSYDRNPLHTYLTSAKYDVKLRVNSSGCIKEINKPQYIATAIEPGKQQQFLLYPNPAHGELFIENQENETLHFMITDLYGKTLLTNYIKPGKNTIDINSLKPGIYILKFNSSKVYKLVIE